MDCPICLEQFDLENNIPRVFPCGHGTCDKCLKMLLSCKKYTHDYGNDALRYKIECP